MNSDLVICREVRDAVQAALGSRLPSGSTAIEEICFLSAALHHHCSGRPGAGLTLGLLQDLLWADMLLDQGKGFSESRSRESPTTYDADYYFKGEPISHKTVGWNGNGDWALAWSKETKRRRTLFESQVVLVVARRPAKSGRWLHVRNGWYIVPKSWLQANVTFVPNDKTDYVVKGEATVRALAFASGEGLFIPIPFDHSQGADYCLSIWRSGRPAFSRRGASR